MSLSAEPSADTWLHPSMQEAEESAVMTANPRITTKAAKKATQSHINFTELHRNKKHKQRQKNEWRERWDGEGKERWL